jgi:hypothetical protein
MTDHQNRRHQMFIRVREFLSQRINDFSANGMVRQLFTQLQVLISGLDGHVTAQASGFGEAHQLTQTRSEARLALKQALEAISRAARAMGLGDKFPPPPPRNDRNLIQAARSAAALAVPLKAQFVLHEMPEDFIDDLNADITAFEASIAGHGSAVDDHVNAGVAIDETIDDGIEIVDKLDPLIRNKYADSPAILAEWRAASHTERAPRRSAQPSTPQPAAPPAA